MEESLNPLLNLSSTRSFNDLLTLTSALTNHVPAINRVLLCLSHSKHTHPFVFRPNSYLTRERVHLLALADCVVEEEMRVAALYEKIWQFPVVLLPFGSSAGNETVVLRPVDSTEAMTAAAFPLPVSFCQAARSRILALKGVDTLLYDLTSKPPGTIEWE